MRTPGDKTLPFVLALLIALVVAGCGGGGDETETTTPTVEEPTALTKDELIEEGDAICAEVNAALGALGASEASETAAADATEKVANLYIGMVERIQELGAPEGDEGDYANFMEAAEELAKVENELKLAAEREDLEAIGEANGEAEVAIEEFQSQAAIYGFEDCSEEASELPTPGTGGEVPGEELEGEEGGVEVEPEFEEEVAPEEEIVPEEEVAPETGGAGGAGEEAPEVAPETGGESGGVGPG